MLPNLTDKNKTKCLLGDQRMAAAVKLCTALNRANVPCVMEHPAGSRMWQRPELRKLASLRGVYALLTDQCQRGARWRKTMQLLTGNLDSFGRDRLSRRCSCIDGRCSRSGRPHGQLSGQAPNGKAWTSIVEHYPRELCHEIISVTLGNVIAQYASNIDGISSRARPPSL